MLRRHLERALREALADRPVVLIHGARQSGKSTLVQSVGGAAYRARYLTLDDAVVLASATADPDGFVAGLDGPTIIDEVQRVPALMRAIKADVDRRRTPGRFLLTGSANILTLPSLSDSLAGRMEPLTLWPLSQLEIERIGDLFVDSLFARSLRLTGEGEAGSLPERILRGGYPEVVTSIAPERRRAWFTSYATTILQRDVRDLADIDGLVALPRLLAMIAARAPFLANTAELSRSLAIPQTTLKRYMALLEMTFLVHVLPAWSGNLGKRLVKAPKLLLADTGLAANLCGTDLPRLREQPSLIGPLLEAFVVTELAKQASVGTVRPALYHFRTHAGAEVDLVLEAPDGRLVGVEVKATAAVAEADFKGLRALQDSVGRRFHRGVVLYRGRQAVPFGGKLHAVPVSVLWSRLAAA